MNASTGRCARLTVPLTPGQAIRLDPLCPDCHNPALWWVPMLGLFDDVGPVKIGEWIICGNCDRPYIEDTEEGS